MAYGAILAQCIAVVVLVWGQQQPQQQVVRASQGSDSRQEDGAEVAYGAIPQSLAAGGGGGETATDTAAAAGGGGKPAL